MGMRYYLKIDGHVSSHVGVDPAYQGWIPIISVLLGASATAVMTSDRQHHGQPPRAGTRAAGIVKAVDSSSAFLLQAVCNGTYFPRVWIDHCQTANGRVVRRMLRVTLTNAPITRYRTLRDSQREIGEELVFEPDGLTFDYNQ